MKLHPYVNFSGNTEEAFNFYKSVFGGDFAALVRFQDMPVEGMEVPASEQNKVMHVSLPVGENILMGSDTLQSMGQVSAGNNAYISIQPDSKAEADRIFNGLSAGGQVEMPIADQVWGDYFGSFVDKFGLRWMINVPQQQQG